MTGWRWAAAVCLAANVTQAAVPPNLAVTVMLKVITYDARFDPEVNTDFVVCLPWVPAQKELLDTTLKALDAVGSSKLGARRVRLKAVPAAELATSLEQEHAAAVLLLPETPGPVVEEASKEATKRKLYSLTLDPATVAGQSMLGVAEESGKPRIVLNPKLAKAAGAEFSPNVLKVARLIQ